MDQPTLVNDKRQQRQVSRPFNCQGQPALMFGAGTGLASRPDTAVLGHVTAQGIVLLIIYRCHFLNAEGADVPLPVIRAAGNVRIQILLSSLSICHKILLHKWDTDSHR
jgi:hypothetical protein